MVTRIRIALIAFVAAVTKAIRSILVPTVDDIVADFKRKIDKLDKAIDVQNERAAVAMERRRALRDQIDATWSEQTAAEIAARSASRIKRNMTDFILN